jgi:hypothetical protein
VIEIDLTSSSLPKLPLFAQFGVPEVWRDADESISILALRGDSYEEAAQSLALPSLTSAALNHLLAQSHAQRRAAWIRRVQEWARQNAPATT